MPSFPKITNQKSTFIIGIHGSVGKDPSCNAGDSGDTGLILGLGRSPGEGNGQPTPVFFPEKSHAHKNLAGYSPGGHKRVGHDLETKQ